jgi:hypothetical protein
MSHHGLTHIVNREDDGVDGRIDIETDDVPELLFALTVKKAPSGGEAPFSDV